MTRSRRTIVTVLATLAVLVVGATAALAQYPPAQDFGVTCTPEDPAPGESTSCTVVGAQSGESLTASAESDGSVFYEEDLTANSDGEAAFGFQVPDEVRGEVLVNVAGEESGETSTSVTAAQAEDEVDEVTPAETEETAGLAATGSQVLFFTVVGLALVAGGGLALRRRSQQA